MPDRCAEERVLIERARAHPVTHATVTGTVRSPDGRPIPEIRITGRAFMERCPGRGVAEAVTRSAEDGRYTMDLPAWPAESFIACVAIHADPPAASLPLPDPIPAVVDAPAYSAVLDRLNLDVSGDGIIDRVELSADASRSRSCASHRNGNRPEGEGPAPRNDREPAPGCSAEVIPLSACVS